MPIVLSVTANDAVDFRDQMHRLAAMLAVPALHVASHDEATAAAVQKAIAEGPSGAIISFPTPAETTKPAGVEEPPKRGRGRPRGSTVAAKAAEAEAAKPAEDAAEWIVRRFGGEQDSAHPTPHSAAARIVELVGAAGDMQALDAILDMNSNVLEALPDDVAGPTADAIEKTREALDAAADKTDEVQPAPAAEARQPAPASAVWPRTFDGKPLTKVQLNKAGAMDAVMSIAVGAPPRFGHLVAANMLQKYGVPRLTAITEENDPRFGQIAAEGAALLGLPTEGEAPAAPATTALF